MKKEKNINRYVLTDGKELYYLMTLFGVVLTTNRIEEAEIFTDLELAKRLQIKFFEEQKIKFSVATCII